MTFTSQQAYEASVEKHKPIMLNASRARKLVLEHPPATFEEFLAETGLEYDIEYDAWKILEFLGY